MNKECDADTFLYFFILFTLSWLVHYFYKKDPRALTADGSIVMAVGIFSLDALQQLPFVSQKLTQLISLELLIIWLYLINSYIKQYLEGYFNKMIQSKINQFGIGTWVAGFAVLAMLFLQAIPSLNYVIWMSAFLSWITWVVYILMTSYNLWLIVFKQFNLNNGIILLPTVATQSVVLLNFSLFTFVPPSVYQILILLGVLFYFIGFFIILKHMLVERPRYLILRWNNTNSIIHGALSITGLAITLTHAFSDTVVLITWIFATSFLIFNEGISILKGIYRIKIAGFFQGILVYHSSQWARIFTLGMYYAFNRNLLEHQAYTNLFIKQVVHYGQDGLLIILLFELFNYFYNELNIHRVETSVD